MDAEALSGGRIAYSFPAGTFDLPGWQEELCLRSEEDHTTFVGLRPDWPRLFALVKHLHVVLGAAAAGPLSVADTWEHPHFSLLPDGRSLLDTESGSEIQLERLGSAIAVVDDHGTQQTASLQFFDTRGKGCLKIMLTNFSNIAVFEKLVRSFAAPLPAAPATPSVSQAAGPPAPPDGARVQALWEGLARSRPESAFPGMEGVTRRAALEAAPRALAWPCQTLAVMRALELATFNSTPLVASAHRDGIYLPVPIKPSHWHPCHAGLTFFSPYAQLTMRRGCDCWEAWATRPVERLETALSLEIYDAGGRLCGVIRPSVEADADQKRDWNAILKSYANL